MSVRFLKVLSLSLVLACGVAAMQSSHAGEGKRPNPVEFILKHEKELNLTGEQKTKLEALAKEIADMPKPPKGEKPEKPKDGGPMAKLKDILTPEQMGQLKELREKEGPPKKKKEETK